jgi:hypothetical protein
MGEALWIVREAVKEIMKELDRKNVASKRSERITKSILKKPFDNTINMIEILMQNGISEGGFDLALIFSVTFYNNQTTYGNFMQVVETLMPRVSECLKGVKE